MDICIDSQDPLIFHASDVRVRQSMDIAMRLSVRAVIFHTNHIANFRLESYLEGWLKKSGAYWRRLLAEYPALTVYLENMFDEEPELLRRLVADGTRSVLFSTHITSDLEKCATHIAFIKDGEMQYTGSLGDFRDHYKDVGVTLEDIIVHVERRPLDEGAII